MTAGVQLENKAAATSEPPVEPNIGRSHALIAASSGLVGVLSYACGLLMAHLLSPADYSSFSAAQALLTVVGVAASSLVPLPLARIVRANRARSEQRRDGTSFAIIVAACAGVATGLAVGLVSLMFADLTTAVTVGVAGFALVLITPAWGWLQGELRLGRFAVVSVGEVALRVVFSVAAAGLAWGASGAVAGYIVGAVLVLGCGLWWMRSDLAWRLHVVRDRARWTETVGVAVVELVTSVLIAGDILLIATVAADSAAAGYQAVATLAKAPVYVATGTVLLSFPLVRATTGDRSNALVGTLFRSFFRLAVPATVIVATVPPPVALLVLPQQYRDSLSALPWLALSGLSYGTIMVAAILLLARRAYRRLLVGLSTATLLLLTGLLLGWARGGPNGLAVGAAASSFIAAGAVLVMSAHLAPRPAVRTLLGNVAAFGLIGGLLYLLRVVPLAWLPVAALVGTVTLLRTGHAAPGRHRQQAPSPSCPPDHLQVLHLGFEDPAAPGAGGGSRRNHEINRRLAAQGHRITMLTTRYPGCRDRIQDGVAYVHIGVGPGRTHLGCVLGYMFKLPFETRRRAAHLVVEDFFAPISSMAAPLWSGRPTLAVVQWLNARDKARQYHLPVHLLERFGTRRHRRMVAVSNDLAAQLTELNPRAVIEVVGCGLDRSAFTATARGGQDILFVGRLETAQKGLDLLLQAWAQAAPQLPGRLVIAGTGPDQTSLRALASKLGLHDRVHFIGWVDGARKHELMARARLIVVPSRFETFGIVAIEALAAGTPVVAFDIPCLREVIPPEGGSLVRPFQVGEYANALISMYGDERRQRQARASGPAFAARYDWDDLARRQERFYRETVALAAAGMPEIGEQNT
jgi:glycosyltransferase involved in cell wall biosynthesis/O-antigen/teichoic acid export membrane protein